MRQVPLFSRFFRNGFQFMHSCGHGNYDIWFIWRGSLNERQLCDPMSMCIKPQLQNSDPSFFWRKAGEKSRLQRLCVLFSALLLPQSVYLFYYYSCVVGTRLCRRLEVSRLPLAQKYVRICFRSLFHLFSLDVRSGRMLLLFFPAILNSLSVGKTTLLWEFFFLPPRVLLSPLSAALSSVCATQRGLRKIKNKRGNWARERERGSEAR